MADQTNPISTHTTTQICKTNPIYPCPSLAHDSNTRNEPNFRIPDVPLPPISAKRTQSTRTAGVSPASRTPIVRNEPNLHPAHDQKCKTPVASKRSEDGNPICPTPTVPRPKKCRSEAEIRPWWTKRTQFPHTRCSGGSYFSETNPISTRFKLTPLAEGQSRFIGKPNFQPPIYILQSIIPWPNSQKTTIHYSSLRRKEGENAQILGPG